MTGSSSSQGFAIRVWFKILVRLEIGISVWVKARVGCRKVQYSRTLLLDCAGCALDTNFVRILIMQALCHRAARLSSVVHRRLFKNYALLLSGVAGEPEKHWGTASLFDIRDRLLRGK